VCSAVPVVLPGVLHLASRQDLQVKVQGVRVDLLEVEQRLAGLPDITGAAVCAVPHYHHNEGLRLVAFLQLSPMGLQSSGLQQPLCREGATGAGKGAHDMPCVAQLSQVRLSMLLRTHTHCMFRCSYRWRTMQARMVHEQETTISCLKSGGISATDRQRVYMCGSHHKGATTRPRQGLHTKPHAQVS
jgi:hypothetical protein